MNAIAQEIERIFSGIKVLDVSFFIAAAPPIKLREGLFLATKKPPVYSSLISSLHSSISWFLLRFLHIITVDSLWYLIVRFRFFVLSHINYSAEALDPTPNEYPGYDTKKSDGEVAVMLGLWGMQNTPSLPLLLGPLWSGMVAPDSPIYGSNWTKLYVYIKLNCLKWNCTYAKLNCLIKNCFDI